MESGIYVIKNIKNGKYYVGSSYNIIGRWYRHKSTLKKNTHHSIKLQNAYNKYGFESFIFEIIQYCNKEYLIDNEQYWINHFNSRNKGYNCKEDATTNRGWKHSDETINKMKAKRKEQIFTEETKKKISDSKSKTIIQYNIDGEFIKEWRNSKDAALELFPNSKYANTTINKNLTGKHKTCGGFIFKYK